MDTAASNRDTSSPRPANHLAGQQSPYLLQHLHNPVDWYPWGDEAFGRARAENRLIFLSVGYSTCHWCHVMERECFEDEETAALLNTLFVCVKVDREERPEIDRLYMSFLQASTGGGGWPMSVWLTPDLKPFFAGTYFPPEDRWGRAGLKTVAKRIAAVWAGEPERIRAHADQVLATLAEKGPEASSDSALAIAAWREAAVRELSAAYDGENGGFGGAPKFPNVGFLALLCDYQAQGSDGELRRSAREMALGTLRKIVESSLRDHIGGGFHRYAVDAHWRLPHFEKMLNDQALLTEACVEAWLISGDPVFRSAAEECLDYLDTQMRDPGGAFRSAEDADSPIGAPGGPRHEGVFYVWTAEELRAALGDKAAAVFAQAYGIRPEGNLDSDPTGEFAGRNLPYRACSVAETAQALGLDPVEVQAILASALVRLCEVRAQRLPPACDDKILCAWNGLALSAYARAAFHFGDRRWSEVAVRQAEFLRGNLHDEQTGRLFRTWRGGRKGTEGYAEDYSCLIRGLLDLFECCHDSRWLEWAEALQAKQDELFRDDAGGYFASVAGDPHVLVRMKSTHDGAEPAASSVALQNKARLAGFLHRGEWLESARADAVAFAGTLQASPLALPQMLAALAWLERAPRQVIIIGQPGEPATEALLAELRKRQRACLSLIVLHDGNRAFFERHDAFFKNLPARVAGAPKAFLCENFTCRLPVSTAAEFAALLEVSPVTGAAGAE